MLFTSAMISFITASLLNSMLLPWFAEQSVKLGVMIFVSLLLFLTAVVMLGLLKTIVLNISQYFTAHRRIERRVLFYSNQLAQAERHFQLKKKRLQYLGQLQRKRLLQKAFKNH